MKEESNKTSKEKFSKDLKSSKESKGLKQSLLKQFNEDIYNFIFEKLFIQKLFNTTILMVDDKDLETLKELKGLKTLKNSKDLNLENNVKNKENDFTYPFVKQKMIDNVVMDYLLKNNNDKIVGIEIKSYMDKIDDRLSKQLTAYHKICHHVVLFASTKHKKKIETLKLEKPSFKEKIDKTIIIYLNDEIILSEIIKNSQNNYHILDNEILLKETINNILLNKDNFIIYEQIKYFETQEQEKQILKNQKDKGVEDLKDKNSFLCALNKYCQFFNVMVSQKFLKQKQAKEIIKKHFDGKNKTKNEILKLFPFDYCNRINNKNKEFKLNDNFDFHKEINGLEKLNAFLTEIVCYFLINYLNYKNEIINSLKEKPKKVIMF